MFHSTKLKLEGSRGKLKKSLAIPNQQFYEEITAQSSNKALWPSEWSSMMIMICHHAHIRAQIMKLMDGKGSRLIIRKSTVLYMNESKDPQRSKRMTNTCHQEAGRNSRHRRMNRRDSLCGMHLAVLRIRRHVCWDRSHHRMGHHFCRHVLEEGQTLLNYSEKVDLYI